MSDDRTSATLGRLRKAIQLLAESIESYERHGTRTVDKLDSDLRTMIETSSDVRVEIARRA